MPSQSWSYRSVLTQVLPWCHLACLPALRHLASPHPPAVCSCLPRALIATPRTGWDSGSVRSLRRVTGSRTQVRSTYNNPSIQQACHTSNFFSSPEAAYHEELDRLVEVLGFSQPFCLVTQVGASHRGGRMRPEVVRCEWSRASCWDPTASPGPSATPPASPAWQCSILPSPPRPPCRDSSPSSGGTSPHLLPQLVGWSTGAEVAPMWRTQVAPGGGVCVPKRHRPGALHRERQLVSLSLSPPPSATSATL